jgi:hypothetical protein
MQAKTVAEDPLPNLAHKWRTHCQQQPQRLLPLRGTVATRARIEHWEEQLIEQINRKDLPLATRAVALRRIIELRGCAVREAATFFGVEPQVVVMALSLLELPPRAAANALPARTKPTGGKSRTKVA